MKLLAGAGLFAAFATAASAQAPESAPVAADASAVSSTVKPARPAPTGDTAMANRGFYLEADTVTRDDKKNVWTARGQVEARYQGRTLRTEELIYDGASGAVTATGRVQIINADGTVEFADSIVLDKDFRTGVAMGFSTRQQQNVKITSVAAIKRSADSTELNRALFTPCDICKDDGVTPKQPTWSIRAERIVQDKKRQLVVYRNAVIQVFGVPVLFAPVFWHPDPTAVRKSGLLPPKIDYTKRRGLTYEQPYLWVINPSADLIVSPQLNTAVNPFLNLDYRQRYWSGQVRVRAGVGYDQDFASRTGKFGDETARSYILADGAFQPTKEWVVGFSAERASDDLIFRRYSVRDVYKDRGLYLTDDQRLISQAYGVRQDDTSYLSVAAFNIQGLRATDHDKTFPTVAPIIEGRWEPKSPILGGRLRLMGDAVVLTRQEDDGDYLTNRAPIPNLPGVDETRGTFEANWRRSITTRQGLRLEPFGDLRTDVYNIRQRLKVDGPDTTLTRALGTVGVDASWPFIRVKNDLTLILEPLAQLAISPDSKLADIPNEDSIVFDFDETNLFRFNKSPGFDLYEGGQRLNVGGRVTASWKDSADISFLLGRSFRAKADPTFPSRTSLQDTSSDWVVAATASFTPTLFFYTRARLQEDTYKVSRAEVGFNVVTKRLTAGGRYLIDETDITGVRREDVQAYGEALITKHWGVTTNLTADLQANVWTHAEVGLLYKDECTRLEIVYERDGTYDRTFTPSSQVSVRLTLATLAVAGYEEADQR